MTRFQIMAIATAIARHEHEVFGDSCLITNLTDLIRKAEQEMLYYHLDPLDALKQAESAMTDVINLIDQANDDRSLRTLGKQADTFMGALQREIRYAETPVEERG